jgi:hypothetical protein
MPPAVDVAPSQAGVPPPDPGVGVQVWPVPPVAVVVSLLVVEAVLLSVLVVVEAVLLAVLLVLVVGVAGTFDGT